MRLAPRSAVDVVLGTAANLDPRHEPLPSQREFPRVRVRALRAFRWRNETRDRLGRITPNGAAWTVAVGEEIDAYLPDGDSLCALGWGERVE